MALAVLGCAAAWSRRLPEEITPGRGDRRPDHVCSRAAHRPLRHVAQTRTARCGGGVPDPQQPLGATNSLFHRKPIVNGSGMVAPPPYPRLNARDDLSPAMLEHLRTYFHPRYIVLRSDLYDREYAPDVSRILEAGREDLRLLAQMGETRIFSSCGPAAGGQGCCAGTRPGCWAGSRGW